MYHTIAHTRGLDWMFVADLQNSYLAYLQGVSGSLSKCLSLLLRLESNLLTQTGDIFSCEAAALYPLIWLTHWLTHWHTVSYFDLYWPIWTNWINLNQPESTRINGNQLESTWINPNQPESTRINKNLPESTCINPYQSESTRINQTTRINLYQPV